MHSLRLYYECIELMSMGTITLPRPEKDLLIEVRSGNWSLEQFLDFAQDLDAKAEAASLISPLPNDTDTDAVSALISKAHLENWRI